MNRTSRLIIASALAVTAMVATTAFAANTQQNNTYPPSSQTQQQSQNFSQSELENFMAARKKVVSIRKDYIPRIQQAENKQKRQQLSQQAGKEMVKAVKSTGMSVQKYNQIAKTANANPKLAQKLKAMQ